MKILHILANAERGGCEKNCYNFIESLPEVDHEVVVLAREGPMVSAWKLLGANVSVLNILHRPLLSFRFALDASLPAMRCDKIIVWTSIRMPVMLSVLNRYTACEIFVHFGNPVVSSFSTRWRNRLLSALLPVRNRVYLRPVSGFVSRYLASDLYYRQFVKKVSMKPIQRPPMRSKKPELLGSGSEVKIGMVARLDPIKDHETVIKAYTVLLNHYPYMQLHLVGDGSLRPQLEELCLTLPQVYFHGEVQNVYEVMHSWDLFVYATTLREGLGGTVPEALSMGLPVVAVDLPMIREWDAEGNFISFCTANSAVSMADKVKLLLENIVVRNRVYEQAPVYIEKHFSPRQFSLNYITS